MRKNSNSKKEIALTSLILIIIIITSSFMLFSCGNEQNKQASGPTQITETKQEKETETSTASEENTVESTTKAKTTSTTSSTKNKTNTNPTKATVKASQTTQAKKVCYITIEGFCSNKKIDIQSGDSVYDILKKSGANVAATNTGYGVYVEGINGRFEFDEGPTSGWVYYVNGSRPNESCNKYSVGHGDSITWDYVDEL